jgi:hypothetical protein
MAKLSRQFDIPKIPWDLMDEARRRTRKVWERDDLDLREPALFLGWNHPEDPADGKSSMSFCCRAPVRQMIENPAVDLRAQLPVIRWGVESLLAGRQAGIPVSNHFGLHMIHFGTGPLATAFGSRMIVREDEAVFYEPAVHTPEEVMRIEKPDLHRAGILPKILERIDFYNEATDARIPMSVCDTALPWSIATQVWHYEDMLEATLTAPQAVHHLLNLVTECIIEWEDIQKARMTRWTLSNSGLTDRWMHRGTYKGDDCMVAVSPAIFEEFFLPYNNRVSRAQGGLCYHCCLKHDWQFPSMIKTEGFMGMDADPQWNDFERILTALDGRGTWNRPVGYGHWDPSGFEKELGWIRHMKGKVGLFLQAIGKSRQEAIDGARRLLDAL